MKIEQELRGTTAWNNARIFPMGVLTVDTDLKQLRVHDGVTLGGKTIANQDNIIGFGTSMFTAVVTASVPGAIAGTEVGKLIQITAPGNYTLPNPGPVSPGFSIRIQAMVAGVNILSFGSTFIVDKNVDLTTTSIDQHALVTLALRDATHWMVMGRY